MYNTALNGFVKCIFIKANLTPLVTVTMYVSEK